MTTLYVIDIVTFRKRHRALVEHHRSEAEGAARAFTISPVLAVDGSRATLGLHATVHF
jgi:hypothetical protein